MNWVKAKYSVQKRCGQWVPASAGTTRRCWVPMTTLATAPGHSPVVSSFHLCRPPGKHSSIRRPRKILAHGPLLWELLAPPVLAPRLGHSCTLSCSVHPRCPLVLPALRKPLWRTTAPPPCPLGPDGCCLSSCLSRASRSHCFTGGFFSSL